MTLAPPRKVQLHPLISVQILNSHLRSVDPDFGYTFGVLLGIEKEGVYELMTSYILPDFSEDAQQVAEKFFQDVLKTHQSARGVETVLGWFLSS
jgi:hypothetical protein